DFCGVQQKLAALFSLRIAKSAIRNRHTFSHGPVTATVKPLVWRFTKNHFESGEKQAPANSPGPAFRAKVKIFPSGVTQRTWAQGAKLGSMRSSQTTIPPQGAGQRLSPLVSRSLASGWRKSCKVSDLSASPEGSSRKIWPRRFGPPSVQQI